MAKHTQKKISNGPLARFVQSEKGIAVLYFLLGGTWILLSDRLLFHFVDDASALSKLQTFKGWFYVAVTALFLYLLVKSSLRRTQKAREELADQQRELDMIVKRLPGMVYRANVAGNYSIVNVSEGCEKLTGNTSEELAGSGVGLLDMVEQEDRSLVIDSIREAVDTKKPMRVIHRIEKKGGHVRWVLHDAIVVGNGKKDDLRLEGMMTDFTTEVETYRTLQESEERFRIIVENTGDGIFVLREHKLTLVNPGFANMFGYNHEELVNTDFDYHDLVSDKDRSLIFDLTEKFEETGETPKTIQIECERKDGTKFQVEISVSTIEWEGEPATIGVLRDISAIRNLEKQLVHSQRLESVGRLAGGVAHDFNNLLTSIGGNAELAQYNLEIGRSAADELREIRKITGIASSLTRRLLTFSRRRPTETRIIDLNNMIGDITILIHRLLGPNIQLVTELGDDIGHVLADEAQMEQVLINLAVNARDAMMEKGGTLTIKTTEVILPDESLEIFFPDLAAGDYVCLSVSDTGMGMNREVMDRIFEPFFTTKEQGQGSGFGLATVYGIVTQAEGAINVESVVGKGSNFMVLLPRKDPESVQVSQEDIVETDRGEPVSVLLVDDNESVRQMLIKSMRVYGVNVQAATEGDAALYALEQMVDPPDVLITDVMMPGMNGAELARRALEKYPKLHVILMSGYSSDIADDELLEDLRVNFLEKPVGPMQLTRKAREVVAKHLKPQ